MRVVVDPPGFDDASGIIQPIEEVFVEALIAQATIEALDEGVLGGLAGRDIVPLDLGVLDPFEDRVTGQFGAIVRDNHLWFSSTHDQLGQLADNAQSGQRDIDHNRQRLPREVIDDAQRPDPVL